MLCAVCVSSPGQDCYYRPFTLVFEPIGLEQLDSDCCKGGIPKDGLCFCYNIIVCSYCLSALYGSANETGLRYYSMLHGVEILSTPRATHYQTLSHSVNTATVSIWFIP